MNTKTALTAVFASLWLMDAAATICFVAAIGPTAEANPIMRGVIESVGIGGFAGIKAGVLGFWLCLQERAHVAVHWGLVAVMAPVVFMGSAMAWGG